MIEQESWKFNFIKVKNNNLKNIVKMDRRNSVNE